MSASQQALGFGRGFSALFAGMRSLLGQTRAWPYALVPALVFMLLEGSLIYLALEHVKPMVSARVDAEGGFWASLAAWLSALVFAGFGWVLSAAFTPPLSAPALERIVGIVEQDLGVPQRQSLSFLAEMWCGIRSMLLGSAITLPIVLALTLSSWCSRRPRWWSRRSSWSSARWAWPGACSTIR